MSTQCGIDPGQFSVSSCLLMCRKSSSLWFGKASTTTLGVTSQVCSGPDWRSQCNLKQCPYLCALSSVTVGWDPDFNSNKCIYSSNITPPAIYRSIPRFVFGATLLILAVIPTLRQSIEMYRATKRWQTNHSMKLLVREGAVYFVVYVSLVPLWHTSAALSFFLPSV